LDFDFLFTEIGQAEIDYQTPEPDQGEFEKFPEHALC
jgi:hypothetical protein